MITFTDSYMKLRSAILIHYVSTISSISWACWQGIKMPINFMLSAESKGHGGRLFMNKFTRQNFELLHLLRRLYLGWFRSDLDKILQRHCRMMEV